MRTFFVETRFALRSRTVVWTLGLSLTVAGLTVILGLQEVAAQRNQIEVLQGLAAEDRAFALSGQNDAGGAAYYSYHLTYSPPTPLGFAALGSRADLPWKHRLKMLALEGQIYENDAGNPGLLALGRLDYALFVATILPLILIFLLHDLDAGERRSRRYELLIATAQAGRPVLLLRALARSALLLVAVLAPLLVGSLYAAAAWLDTVLMVLAVMLNVVFWLIAARLVCGWGQREGATAAASLLGVWVLVTILVPVGAQTIAARLAPVPEGGEILLQQREIVNRAWDLPKASTMEPFLAEYPEWRPYAAVERPFEWKWYYAFQEVGDQSVREDASALEHGIAERDLWMARFALLSPALMTERLMVTTARTSVRDHLAYIQCVRNFHAALRRYHYPALFGVEAFTPEFGAALPQYAPCAKNGT